MKNIKFVLVLFLLSIITATSFYFYKNLKEEQSNIHTTTDTTTATFFIDDELNYNSYSYYERYMIDKVLLNNQDIKKQILGPYTEAELPTYKEGIKLKYYDKQHALLYLLNFKGGYSLVKVNLHNYSATYYKQFLFGNYTSNKDYLVVYSSDKIEYMKAGDYDFYTIDESIISGNETYIEQSGFGDSYEASLNNNIFKISLFKNKNKSDIANTKLREVEFVLP